MNWAALFPGQGTQHAGMLPWLSNQAAAAPLLQSVATTLGDDWRTRLGDPAWRRRNDVAQPLLTGLSLAAWATLADRLGPPAVVAGYSVGELAAWACAGVFDSATAMHLAGRRAALMDAAAGDEAAGMLSVAGLHEAVLARLAAQHGLHTAIHIGPAHQLLAGGEAALLAATPVLAALGAEVKRLEVATASHTPLMAPAAEAFAAALQPLPFSAPHCPVVNNLTGTASRDPARLKQALAQQIAQPVQWQQCMQTLAERQPRCVLEIGPGHSLAGLWRAAQPQIPARSLEDFHDWRAAADWVAAQQG